ncbi:23274_t:CDS:2 [Gigaspora margarita]|uniref:23274_t:CDS:1 n=1 Tax=Gigaspora margarita TaxID=4874 RepID=A0ABM8VWA5_GIGMA|nr:23274_t:CDS:2 [Gigaspora margarita]
MNDIIKYSLGKELTYKEDMKKGFVDINLDLDLDNRPVYSVLHL